MKQERVITVTVNGRCVQLSDGATLLDAVKLAGAHVPSLCFNPGLPARAACRMCLVEVAGEFSPLPACRHKARQGDRIETDTKALQTFRRTNTEWLLGRHRNDCLHCEVSGSCQLQRLAQETQHTKQSGAGAWSEPSQAGRRCVDHTSPGIWMDVSKCIQCGLCADACGQEGQQQFVIGFAQRGSERLPVTAFDKPLEQTNCISCGQCTLVCPVGALTEASHWREVLQIVESRRRVSVVQVAPATRIAISEEFGMAPGTVSTGRLINALRQLGFDYVFDTNFAADLTVMEEASELIERLKTQTSLPLLTSCCPAWIKWVEINRPDILGLLSTTKSPQQIHGAVAKRGQFARSLGPDFAAGLCEPYVVGIMPCTAKKDEAVRPGVSGDVDHVLTTRELARMIRSRDIAFGALSQDGQFDRPLGASSGAAQMFAASGGVMEALVRTAVHLQGGQDGLGLEWRTLRGVREGMKAAHIPGIGDVAVCNGIAPAQRMLATQAWRTDYVAIEVMACVGGCLGGGGEPKSMDPDILQKRSQAVYRLDQSAPRRCSYENLDVQDLYATQLAKPNSSAAKALLHTHYAARHSPRSLLMRFLDCVDRRDGEGAARLFHGDGVWSTGAAYGDIQGSAAIAAFINAQLPARFFGARQERHVMAIPADTDDLSVVSPDGQRCTFVMETCEHIRGDRSSMAIKRLVRQVEEHPRRQA